MIVIRVCLAALRWCLLQWDFWAILCVILLLGQLAPSAPPVASVGAKDFVEGSWYVAAFALVLPGGVLGMRALARFRAVMEGARQQHLAASAAVLSVPGVALATACLLVGAGPHTFPPAIAALDLGLAALCALTWAWICGRLFPGGLTALHCFLAGLCLARMFPPPCSVVAGHPLPPWLLPMLGLMLAIWLLEPARTSTR